jgi:hypothetical protein
MNVPLRTAALFLLLALLAVSPVMAGPLEGVWKNVDPNARSVPRLRIFVDDKSSPMLEVWLKQGGKEVKKEPFALTLFGDSVSDKEPNKHAYARNDVFISNGPLKFAEEIFFITSSGDELIVEHLKIYNKDFASTKGEKENAERSNQRARLVFKKQ